jgi:hypothetical protein
VKALIGGTAASLLNGAIAGMLIEWGFDVACIPPV